MATDTMKGRRLDLMALLGPKPVDAAWEGRKGRMAMLRDGQHHGRLPVWQPSTHGMAARIRRRLAEQRYGWSDAMIYNQRIATVSEHEHHELMAIVRNQARLKSLSDDDRWRADYAEEQRRRRIVGYQQDLFSSAAITHYRRSPAAPIVERPPVETIAAKLVRIKGDPAGDLRSTA